MKGAQGAGLILVALAAAIVLIARRQGGLVSLTDAHRNINHLVPTPAEETAYWAANATGNPSTAASTGAGTTQPGTIGLWLGNVWRGDWTNYRAPNAGTTTQPTRPANPAGRATIGPATPSRYVAQSQIERTSLLLSPELSLSAPLAFNPFYMQLSGVDPYIAAAAGAGGYVDVQQTATVNGLPTGEHA